MSDNKATLKDVVAAWLRKNPDFLKDFPELLELLNLPHATGVASSLIERQVKQLRELNQDLNRQLNRLMHVAAENEQLMTRLHHLTLELMATPEPADFFQLLESRLKENFRADITRVVLFDGAMAAAAGKPVLHLDEDSDQAALLLGSLSPDRTHALCGRLNEAKLSLLFEDKAQWVKSTALVPVGEQGREGILAIGSSDPARFYPGMGTLFLELLANVIDSSLNRARQTAGEVLQPEEQRRTA